jgi:fumarate hydratase subunit beta
MAEYELTIPLTDNDIRKLKIKDAIYLTGEILTVRDSAYERILQARQSKKTLPFDLKGKAIWHAGPITKQEGNRWKAVSVGSTTSGRFTGPAAQLIHPLGIRLVIGKGPMGKEVQDALAQSGAAYVMTTGGAAAYYANQVTEVSAVHWLDLGMPAAVWVFQVKRLGPLIVVMDSHGANFFDEIREKVDLSLNSVFKEFKIDPAHNFLWWPKDNDR